MKSKGHILVVEDKSLIYKRIKMLLKEHHYTVEDYTPSVKEAIANINKIKPDLVLLDIDLKGEHKGTYLGELLSSKYNIPFIYVTDFDDNQTFYEGLKTKHGDFISKNKINLNEENLRIIQTKPHLDEERLIRSIQTVLEQNKKKPVPIIKNSILAYVDYVKKTKELGVDELTQVPIALKEIAFFTTDSEEVDEDKTKNSNKTIYVKLQRNNARIQTWLKKSYIVPSSLSVILKSMPNYFVRINDYYIVNIDSEFSLQGRINGKYIKVADQVLEISDRYKADVEHKIENLYQKIR
ncbi:response regulator [uncultured Polaribacter sp.]|uniref:response regulator transcription factor n=1 Tax=uncultured Polaribacter sp. TaxID=174711 RepID=UPI0026328B57|nr:response regulator [uncultured Polaribacter sp.]